MHLLLIRFSALGDVAMLAPVIREYLASTPCDVEVSVLSRPFCQPLFADLGPRCHFIGADLKGEYRGIAGLTRLFRRLHAMHFDAVCDMHSVLRTHYLRLLFRLFGYRVAVINKRRDERKRVLSHDLTPCTTSFEKYREVLAQCGGWRVESGEAGMGCVEGGNRTDTQTPPPVETPYMASVHVHTPNSTLHLNVALAPFAAHKGKIYPVEMMQDVIRLLVEQGHTVTLFGGGQHEMDIMRQWQQQWPDSVTLAADRAHGLGEELQLMREMDVMVSMDSANMHLASIVGTRVVSIWGATHPAAGFLGYGQSLADCVQRDDLPCRPCSIYGNKPCQFGEDDYRCMRQIKPEDIVTQITKQLKS